MFDPTRDEVATRPYVVRLGIIVLTALAVGAAVMPLVTGYSAGPDGQTTCVAARDAWSGRAAPADPGPAPIGPSRNSSPVEQAQFEKSMKAYYARPDVKAAMDYSTWLDGVGACRATARHRLMLSAFGLGAIGLVGFGTFLVGATRRRKRALAAAL